jgi:hypothetical protein
VVVVAVMPVIAIPPVVPVVIPVSSVLAAIPVVPLSPSVIMVIRAAAGEREQQRQGKQFFHDGLLIFMIIGNVTQTGLRHLSFDVETVEIDRLSGIFP